MFVLNCHYQVVHPLQWVKQFHFLALFSFLLVLLFQNQHAWKTKFAQYVLSLHTWWSVFDNLGRMLRSTVEGAKEFRSGHDTELNVVGFFFYFWSVPSCCGLTCCHVETNHWTFRSFWQRFKKQGSWLLGLGRPTHELSGSACVLSPGWALVQTTALFFRPLPHFREHWNDGIWPWNTSGYISQQAQLNINAQIISGRLTQISHFQHSDLLFFNC